MSLSSALVTAQSALANTAAQSAVLSKNIANVDNTNYSSESVASITQINGGAAPGVAQRATSTALLNQLLSSQSASTSSQALSDGLTQIADELGLDSASETSTTAATDSSPSTLIGSFTDALQQYQAQPDNEELGAAAVSAAKALVTSLNQSSSTVQAVRQQADSSIATSVQTINSLLTQFKTANDQVVAGTATSSDTTNAEDTRDGILKQLSNEIGINTVEGANGSMQIYTDSGATLFETNPRTVSFTPTSSYSAGTTGQAVTVDGVPITGSSAVMPIKSGRLAGLTTLRDQTAVSYQNQLDQIASSLVSSFAETDPNGGGGTSTVPGLFTAPGLAGLPTGANTTGLAAQLTVNASADPSAGGDVTRLRDGNISDPTNTTNNPNGDAAYSTWLQQLSTSLGATQSFNSNSGGAASGSVAAYAASSVSWLEASRQTASTAVTSNNATASTATTALSNATGVNLDDEMSKMLDVEHAYQASAQLLNTVNQMLSSLLQAVN